MMQSSEYGPIVLLADSQLLFSAENNRWFFETIKSKLVGEDSFAVYVGASNGNEPVFFQMAQDALEGFGISSTLFLKQGLEDLGEYSDKVPSVILLAGGDVALGWQLLRQPSISAWIDRCYRAGTLLMGISAGAIHLTHGVFAEQGKATLFSGYGYLPLVTMVHEEADHWPSEKLLRDVPKVKAPGTLWMGVKIPFGGGIWSGRNTITSFGRAESEIVYPKGFAKASVLPSLQYQIDVN